MGFILGDKTAAAIGSLAGKFLGSGQNDNYTKGILEGARARQAKASAKLDEDKASYIAEAIKRGLANDYQGANVYSLYGYGGGKTSYAPTTNGAIFNAVNGTLDSNTPLAAAFLDKQAADVTARNAQASQYNAAAGLNNARTDQVRDMIPYDQLTRTAQAQNSFASAADNQASANYHNQQSEIAAKLLPYDQLTRTAQAQNSFASAADNQASAALHTQQAQRDAVMAAYDKQKALGDIIAKRTEFIDPEFKAGSTIDNGVKVPHVGYEEGGYVFLGGDPTSPSSWLRR